MTPDEAEAMKSLAKKHGLPISDWCRKRSTSDADGSTIQAQKVVEIPSQVDADFARQVAALGNNANQIARALNVIAGQIGKGTFKGGEIGSLLMMAESVQTLADQLSGMSESKASRFIQGMKLILGQKAKRS